MKTNLKMLPFLLLSGSAAILAGSSPSALATELIVNGNLESGTTGWTLSGGTTISTYASLYHSATHYLWFGDDNSTDVAYQDVAIPSTATSATLSFYYNINTSETSGTPDTFSATIRNTSGSTLATVGNWSNLNGTTAGSYSQQTYNVLPYAGSTIRIYFTSTCTLNGTKTTNFRVDDVSVQVTTSQTKIISLSGNLAFGSVAVGSTPQSTLTIYNTDNSTMTVNSISYPSAFSGSWSGTIAAGGSHAVTVTFSPTSATSYGGTVTVNSDATSGVNTISASGTGTVTSTRVISLGGNLAFGSVAVGSSPQTALTIYNTGNGHPHLAGADGRNDQNQDRLDASAARVRHAGQGIRPHPKPADSGNPCGAFLESAGIGQGFNERLSAPHSQFRLGHELAAVANFAETPVAAGALQGQTRHHV
jgi:hypothetical protein